MKFALIQFPFDNCQSLAQGRDHDRAKRISTLTMGIRGSLEHEVLKNDGLLSSILNEGEFFFFWIFQVYLRNINYLQAILFQPSNSHVTLGYSLSRQARSSDCYSFDLLLNLFIENREREKNEVDVFVTLPYARLETRVSKPNMHEASKYQKGVSIITMSQ